LEGHKQQRIAPSTTYMDFKLIPIPINVVERYFRNVKLNMTTLQNALLPSTLENITFLLINASLMSMMTVQKAINA
jgi:hypothetical protein